MIYLKYISLCVNYTSTNYAKKYLDYEKINNANCPYLKYCILGVRNIFCIMQEKILCWTELW